MKTRRLPGLLLLPALLVSCSSGSSTASPSSTVAASAPAPGITLPPDALADLVPTPDEVPAGMVLVLKGSGPRDAGVVASYSGAGAAATAAAASLRSHGFTGAYVAQYVNPANAQVLSIVASRFATAAGATADFVSDESAKSGNPLSVEPIGEASSGSVTDVAGGKQLVLLRFRKGTTTWSLAYQGPKPADPAVAVTLAQALVVRVS